MHVKVTITMPEPKNWTQGKGNPKYELSENAGDPYYYKSTYLGFSNTFMSKLPKSKFGKEFASYCKLIRSPLF